MSRTLRRPMFRGGPVSSYGTGIAAPLVPGYQSGGQIGGGIIHGLPHADGRYGFRDPIITGGDLMSMNREEALKLAERYGPSSIDKSFYNVNSFKPYIPTTVIDEDMTTETEIDSDYNYIPKRADSDVSDGLDYSWAVEEEEKGPEWHEDIYIDEEGKLQQKKEEKIPEIPKDPNLEEIARLQAIINAKEEPTELDAKTAVADRKALFADLLGVDKARGQDISDMLLGFAGSEGEGWDKFQKFAATEAQRPGRRQKIEDAAGTLAIQDYIAGKKSTDALKLMMAQEDYRPKAKLKALMPTLDDTPQMALIKFAQINGTDNVGSARTIKDAIEFKTKQPVVTNTKIKLKDIDNPKKQKHLKMGYNIIEEDTIKYYVKWDGIKADILTFEEIWAGR